MRQKKEEELSIQICRYLDYQYKNIIYTCDLSGIRLPMGLAVKAKKQRCKKYKIPDLLIFEPRNGYHGLIIELKKNREEVYTKSNEIRQSEHILAQSESLNQLQSLGYKAVFGCGFDNSKKIIDEYFK
jgi:hypothetical protein